jgi:hypothetical protein
MELEKHLLLHVEVPFANYHNLSLEVDEEIRGVGANKSPTRGEPALGKLPRIT